MIEIAIAVCDGSGMYMPNACVMMQSIFDHTKEKIRVNVFHDETVNHEKRVKFEKFINKNGSLCRFIKISIPEIIIDIPSLKNITAGTLFRLYIPSRCCDVSKIIYLDIDLFVHIDISELWSVKLGTAYAAVVKDVKKTRERDVNNKYYRKLHIDNRGYFNAGVAVLNCDMIRRNIDLIKQGIDFLVKYQNLMFADQDVLNKYFANNVVYIDERFNYQIDLNNMWIKDCIHNNVIIHFSGMLKPWNCMNEFVIEKYIYYLKKSGYLSADEFSKFISGAVRRYDNKNDLKNFLLTREKNDSMLISFLLIMKGLISNDAYFYVIKKIWRLRHWLRYNLIYCYKEK